EHHGREHGRHPSTGVHRDTGEIVVGPAEPRRLLGFTDEGADHADPGDLLAEDLIDPVDPLLHQAEAGDHSRHDHEHHDGLDRYGDGEEPCQTAVFAEGHENAAYRHHRRQHEHGEPHAQQLLDLLDVVGGAGEERRGPETIHLLAGEPGDLVIDASAEIPTDGHGRP